jgi:hypothetical protein
MHLSEIFRNNEKWVSEKLALSPDYFKNLSRDQTPEFLYYRMFRQQGYSRRTYGIERVRLLFTGILPIW